MIEEMLYRDDFEIMLRRQGWHMTRCKPLYNDPEVVMIRKPSHVLSRERGPSAWHRFLSENTFRKLLRALLNKPRSSAELSRICGDQAKLDWYLLLLEDAGIIVRGAEEWTRGPECEGINNIGATLEWYVAEWFRSILRSPARHGVSIEEVPRGGDLDVVAFVNDVRVMVECKTAKPSAISESELRWFLQRAADFNPEIAILLIDTESSAGAVVDRLNEIYLDMARTEIQLDNPALLANARFQPSITGAMPGFKGLYWGGRHIYVTGAQQSIDVSLSSVLRLYHSYVRHLSFLSGSNTWDFVAGTVSKAPNLS